MVSFITDSFVSLMTRGGWVMWPLLGLSLLAVTLAFERLWFWVRNSHGGQRARVARMARMLRDGDTVGARALAQDDTSVYGRVVMTLLDGNGTDAAASDAVESQRPRLQRFMPTLSTIITAAPMLGILGTVTGIIASFEILSDQVAATDPRNVSRGIAEALLTTAAGLAVALIVLFPYNFFRAQIDGALGRIESLVTAAQHMRLQAKSTASAPHEPVKAQPPPLRRVDAG